MAPISPFFQAWDVWLDRSSRVLIFISSCALVVLVATFGWLVFGRYVLNVTPTWVEQLALLLVTYIAFLGAAAGIHEDTHLGVTLLRDACEPRMREAFLLVTDLILAMFGGVLFIASIELFQFGWATLLPMLNIPESIRTASALICSGMIFIFAGARAVLRVVHVLNGSLYSKSKAY